jgi:hypothetical protein
MLEKKAPLTKCDHGRNKHECRDCGTGHCVHGRLKYRCNDCGTGHCVHGPHRKSQCKDCGTGHCVHGRLKREPLQGGLRYGLLRARAPEEPLQGLRYGLLRARAQHQPEGSLQGLQCIGNRQQTIDNSQ